MKLNRAGFSMSAVLGVVLALALPAWAHPNLTGHWVLIPEDSTFRGQPATETGDITIEQRHGQLFISRHLNVDGDAGGMAYNFSTDGHVNSTIHEGHEMKTKASWDGDTLKVRTTMHGEVTLEQYRISPEKDQLLLTVDTPDHQVSTLVFRRG